MKFIKYWLPVIGWCLFIFLISHQPDLKSDLPGAWDFFLRKLAHMAEFGLLAILFFRGLSGYGFRINHGLVFASVFSLLYAISDEYHQTFIQERIGSFIDVAIDSVGILIAGLTIWYFYGKIFKRPKTKNKRPKTHI